MLTMDKMTNKLRTEDNVQAALRHAESIKLDMRRIKRAIGMPYSEQIRRALAAWCAAQLKGRHGTHD